MRMFKYAASALVVSFAMSASASPAEFYAGKTITLVVGTTAGGGYDADGRLVARYLGRFIPGNPDVVVSNMPGASGIRAANALYVTLPRDGTYIGTFNSAMPFLEALGTEGVRYKSEKFSWIGNLSQTPQVIVVWHTAGVHTLEQAKKKQLLMGALGSGGTMSVFPVLSNATFHTKFKVVAGYEGGNEVNLAMERGEVQGRGAGTWTTWNHTHSNWVEHKDIIPILQIGPKKDTELPDVPLASDLATNSDDKKLWQLVGGNVGLERPLVAPPGIPRDRLEMLRNAYARMVKDPSFLAEAKRLQSDVDPRIGDDALAVVKSIVDAPPKIIERAKELVSK